MQVELPTHIGVSRIVNPTCAGD